jgi:hypothetical protein
MKSDALVFLLAIGLTSCSEPEISNLEFNKGRHRAEVEGCHCNTGLATRNEKEIARHGKGWPEGYVEACIRFKKERRC